MTPLDLVIAALVAAVIVAGGQIIAAWMVKESLDSIHSTLVRSEVKLGVLDNRLYHIDNTIENLAPVAEDDEPSDDDDSDSAQVYTVAIPVVVKRKKGSDD